jgi:hypothetical protein
MCLLLFTNKKQHGMKLVNRYFMEFRHLILILLNFSA